MTNKSDKTEPFNVERYFGEWMRAGYKDIQLYSQHGSGVHLFRAYVKQREADRQRLQARREHLESALKDWQRREGYIADIVELAMLNVLDNLDPIIADLLSICEGSAVTDPATALKKLRHALRIGRGHSRYDADLEATRRYAIYLWYRTYLWMNSGGSGFQSESAIATGIAEQLKISKRSALNYWERAKRDNRVLEALANDASARAKDSTHAQNVRDDRALESLFEEGLFRDASVRAKNSARAQPANVKPASTIAKKRSRRQDFSFGKKKRANP